MKRILFFWMFVLLSIASQAQDSLWSVKSKRKGPRKQIIYLSYPLSKGEYLGDVEQIGDSYWRNYTSPTTFTLIGGSATLMKVKSKRGKIERFTEKDIVKIPKVVKRKRIVRDSLRSVGDSGLVRRKMVVPDTVFKKRRTEEREQTCRVYAKKGMANFKLKVKNRKKEDGEQEEPVIIQVRYQRNGGRSWYTDTPRTIPQSKPRKESFSEPPQG